jgi:uncharacterized membrane protein YuzA (DUF378 family)
MVPVNRETRILGLSAALLAAYVVAMLATGLIPLDLYTQLLGIYLSMAMALWLMVGLAAAFLFVVSKARESKMSDSPFLFLANLLRTSWERDRWLSSLWPPVMFGVLMATFNSFKQLILPEVGFQYDASLAALDKVLFLGADPWRVTHALLPSAEASLFLDRLYHGWFAPMSLGVIICAWLPSTSYRLRTQYLLTYMGVWILLGSVTAYALPAAGPCFMVPLVDGESRFGELSILLQSQQAFLGDTKLLSLLSQARLLESVGSEGLTIGGGISAMPSVHNGLSILFAIAAFNVRRWLGYVMASYALLIWIGSIHLGWHYAIDGIVAIAMTLVIWHGSGRLADWGAKATKDRQPLLYQAIGND